jgi:SAM-dependent methyltransferase
MRFADVIPQGLKQVLRPYYRRGVLFFRKIFHRPRSREYLLEYWKQPSDEGNRPKDYLEGGQRSGFLVDILKKYAGPEQSVLEIGCNVGRNLNCLFQSGFLDLSGIEINESAVLLLKQQYPEMAARTKIHNAPVEDVIKKIKDNEVDAVFSMAVLEHIHSQSEWVFQEIVRITKDVLITIEDEEGVSWRHFPRNYKKIFEGLGMRQVEVRDCAGVSGLGATFAARVFKKK